MNVSDHHMGANIVSVKEKGTEFATQRYNIFTYNFYGRYYKYQNLSLTLRASTMTLKIVDYSYELRDIHWKYGDECIKTLVLKQGSI